MYDDIACSLYVQFPTGRCWKYHAVDYDLFKGFMEDSSHGVFFNQCIKGKPNSEIPFSEFDGMWEEINNFPPLDHVSLLDAIHSA
jgi:hypothetical protein